MAQAALATCEILLCPRVIQQKGDRPETDLGSYAANPLPPHWRRRPLVHAAQDKGRPGHGHLKPGLELSMGTFSIRSPAAAPALWVFLGRPAQLSTFRDSGLRAGTQDGSRWDQLPPGKPRGTWSSGEQTQRLKEVWEAKRAEKGPWGGSDTPLQAILQNACIGVRKKEQEIWYNITGCWIWVERLCVPVVLFFNLIHTWKLSASKVREKKEAYSNRVVVSQQDSVHFGQVLRESPDTQHPQSSQCTRLLGLLNSLKFHTLEFMAALSRPSQFVVAPSPLPSGSQVQGLRKQVSHNEPVAQSRLYFTPSLQSSWIPAGDTDAGILHFKIRPQEGGQMAESQKWALKAGGSDPSLWGPHNTLLCGAKDPPHPKPGPWELTHSGR